MSNQADHTIVRLRVPPELKQKIEESAEENNRSQSAEMVARLEQSYKDAVVPTTPEIQALIANTMSTLISSLVKEGVDVDKIKGAIEKIPTTNQKN